MLALLMCKDTLENKAALFMDTLISRAGLSCGRTSIASGNSRLKKALKLFIYFAEIFPKKYWQLFEDDINEHMDQNASDKKTQKPIARKEPAPLLDSEYGFLSENKSAISMSNTLKNSNYELGSTNGAKNKKMTAAANFKHKLSK